MASRKEQKEAARQRRLAEEQAAAAKRQRTRRVQMLGGVIAAAIIVVVVLVVVSSGGSGGKGSGPTSKADRTKTTAAVDSLLKGIPQHGNVLGNPHAGVTVTEYGDLVCPICRQFALGAGQQLIAKDVRSGKVKLVYRALETASQAANHAMFVPGQVAARAAGEQKRGWNYIETFYREQQSEDDSYVTTAFLQGLARQVTGLNFAKWNSERSSSTLSAQVNSDTAAAQNAGFNSTPTIVVQGPVAQAKPIVGAPTYSSLESAIKSVYQ